MARGRLVSRSLGSSRKFAALQKQAGKLGEFAQALYPLLIAVSDDFGRQSGDAFTVKHAVFPTSPRHEADFASALTSMHHVGLIRWYEAQGQQVIQVVDFDAHQPNLHKRSDKSKFPEPPGDSGKVPEIPSELNLTQLKRTEPKRTALSRVGDDLFEAFWLAYPKKKSRSDAERAWRNLAPSPELSQRILDAVAAQRNSPDWLKSDGQFIPYPATWVNGRRWEDQAGVERRELPEVGDWCHHAPRCHSPVWHQAVLARERGEAV
jgi:hypothetical protein